MKTQFVHLSILVWSALVAISCQDSATKNEVWPKSGYLFTLNYDLDSTYVAAEGSAVRTTRYHPKYPLDDNSKQWTISVPSSGKGVLVHNDQGAYWSIDSAFHPGLNVKQRFLKVTKLSGHSEATDYNRFIYHKGSDGRFYIESVKFPDYYVTGLPHAESGRGLLLRHQSNGSWDFWLGTK